MISQSHLWTLLTEIVALAISVLIPSLATISTPTASPSSSPTFDVVCSLAVASTYSHAMVTKSQNQVSKPMKFTNGRVRYPTPTALTRSLSNTKIEPMCFTNAIKHVA